MLICEPPRYASHLYGWPTPDEFTGGAVAAYGPPDPTPPGALPYADILNPQSLNKYQYAYNNPFRYIDPTGHRSGECVTTSECLAGLSNSPAQDTVWNIQVIRSDNLSKGGQAAVDAQIADLAANMAKIGVTVNVTSDSIRSNIDLAHINPNSFDKGATPYFFVTSQEAGSKSSGAGFVGKTVGVVINEFVNYRDKGVTTHETLHILRGDIYTKNPNSWGKELHVDWETFKLKRGWTGGMEWLTKAAGNPPNQ